MKQRLALCVRHAIASAVCCIGASHALAAPLALAPQYADSWQTGAGAFAQFLRTDPNWHGSTVLWNEAEHRYGDGQAIGTYGWGTGIWGQADWQALQNAAAGQGGASAPPVLEQWTGTAATINYANDCYNTQYSGTWGAATPLPFDGGACGSNVGNWTSYFTGFVRITDPGLYNFSVLYDDGFFFRLYGQDGASVEIGRDFLNARDRQGFVDDLDLGSGLYGFQLGTWNRLEAGVVDLRWSRGDQNWTVVPTSHLLTPDQAPGALPEPGTVALLGVAVLAAMARRRRLL